MNKFFDYIKLQSKIHNNQRGFSLLEILLAIVTVGILILLLVNIPNSIRLVSKSNHQSLAREVAAKALEDVRATQYVNLANGESAVVDNRLNLLPGAGATRLVKGCDPTICTQGEETKHVKVTVTWRESGQKQTVILETLVSKGGLNQ